MNTAIATLSAFGTFCNRVAKTTTPKKVDPKVAFAQHATKAIEALQSGTKNKWIEVKADGTVNLQLKRGITALVLNGSNQLVCPNVQAAVAALNQAITLASAGLLDAELAAAAPKPRTKKTKTEAIA